MCETCYESENQYWTVNTVSVVATSGIGIVKVVMLMFDSGRRRHSSLVALELA